MTILFVEGGSALARHSELVEEWCAGVEVLGSAICFDGLSMTLRAQHDATVLIINDDRILFC